MPKAIKLNTGQSLRIAGVQPGSIIAIDYAGTTATQTLALEIDDTTSQPALVEQSDSWLTTQDDQTLFTLDNRLLEYANE